MYVKSPLLYPLLKSICSFCCALFIKAHFTFVRRRKPPEGEDGLHPAPDRGAGARVRGLQLPQPTPEVRDRCGAGPHRAPGQGLVPEQADEVEAD